MHNLNLRIDEIDTPEKQRIAKLLKIRAGKKGSITKRIEQLSRLVSEGGSRTKIKYLLVALVEVVNATKDVCRGDPDQEWIEQVTMRVDTCAAEVQDYIDARKDDAPSFASLTESWVRTHAPAGARS